MSKSMFYRPSTLSNKLSRPLRVNKVHRPRRHRHRKSHHQASVCPSLAGRSKFATAFDYITAGNLLIPDDLVLLGPGKDAIKSIAVEENVEDTDKDVDDLRESRWSARRRVQWRITGVTLIAMRK